MSFKCIRQTDLISCGATCIQMICNYYGKEIPLEVINNAVGLTNIGASVLDLYDGLKNLHFQTVVVNSDIHRLKKLPLPIILYWRNNHFVVLYKIKNNRFYIADPAAGKIKFRAQDFLENWGSGMDEGTAILALPTPEFMNVESPTKTSSWKKVFLDVLKRTIHSKKKIIFIIFLIFLSCICNWYVPVLYKNLIDKGVLAGDLRVVVELFVAQLSFFIGYILFTSFSSILLLKINSSVAIEFLGSLLKKIIKLPLKFFDSTLHTEMLQRFEDFNRLQRFISDSLIYEIFAIVSLVVFSILLASYNLIAVIIFYFISFISIYINAHYLNERKYIDYTRFAQSSRNFNNILEMLQGMRDLKIHGAESLYVSKWEKTQVEVNNLALQSSKLELRQNLYYSSINKFRDICIIGFCSFVAIDGNMTMGGLISTTYLLGMMSSPMNGLSGFFKIFQDAKISSERISSIQSKENEESGMVEPNFKVAINLNNVSFKYPGHRSPLVFSSLSIKIPKGKVTAIVGHSGCGKTTLLKLLLGFYTPSDGDILIDNERMSNINIQDWRNKCGIVFQDGFIFSGTIAENISMTKDIDLDKLDKVCHDACVGEFALKFPLKYNTPIGSSGVNLSQGQKQRILIARALYKDPDFFIFDEATSSLDSTNESVIMGNILSSCKGKTIVIIAHRLSTVKKADQIIVIDEGKAKETGTHYELLFKRGVYYRLIKEQINWPQ